MGWVWLGVTLALSDAVPFGCWPGSTDMNHAHGKWGLNNVISKWGHGLVDARRGWEGPIYDEDPIYYVERKR